MRKLVCTTLRPLRPASPLLTDLEGIAAFVADWMNYEPPETAQQPPGVLVAPDTALRSKVGTCRVLPLPLPPSNSLAGCALRACPARCRTLHMPRRPGSSCACMVSDGAAPCSCMAAMHCP